MRLKNVYWLATGLLITAPRSWGTALDPFLLRPNDLPLGCATVSGQYPTGPKIDSLFQYKTYQSVLPKAADRHAQSFRCGSERGTIYYFQYWSSGDKDKAALFARPVVSKEMSAWVDWSNGFAIFSFKQAPASLIDALQKKTGGPRTAAPAVPMTPARGTGVEPMIAPSTAPRTEFKPLVSVPPPANHSAVLARVEQTPLPPAPVIEAAPVALPASGLSDIPDEVLGALARIQGCSANSPLETRKVCQTLVDFRAAHRPSGFIPVSTVLVAQAYRIDSYGRLEEHYYDVLVGNGHPGEISLFAIKPANGTEDFEAQSVFDAKQKGMTLPTNSVRAQIDRHPRPDRPMVGATDHISIVLLNAGNKRVYFRQKDNHWIALGVNGSTPEEQGRSSFVVAYFY